MRSHYAIRAIRNLIRFLKSDNPQWTMAKTLVECYFPNLALFYYVMLCVVFAFCFLALLRYN